jgi:outer membrane receptor protein involved in Fe transport
MKKLLLLVSLGSAFWLAGFQLTYAADEPTYEGKYIEEVIVTGERGEVNVMDRPMTVTGFNLEMIENLGIQNVNDLEVLVPGLQVGNRSQGGGKLEDDHYYMRGIGSERSVNFFSDTAVAVYVDGVWTDQTYGIDDLFDLERVEVARGPQGTTGGRAAMAGAINFYSRKPTDEFDLRINTEFTDVSTQRFNMAFGGPISDSGFSYRLALQRFMGDGYMENKGMSSDPGEPDQTIIAPSLRWKNERWDVTARYSYQEDKGTPDASLPLGGVNTVDQFILDADGNCLTVTNPDTGLEECQRNPYFGNPASPSTAGCDNINNDGTRDELDIICDPEDLRWEVAYNAPIEQDSSAENFSIDAIFAINDGLSVNYKFGWRDVENRTVNDTDATNRTGGGVCLADHPKVAVPTYTVWTEVPPGSGNWLPPGTPVAGATAMLQEGQVSQYCALDGGGVGTFSDTYYNSVFTSEQISHEITLVSDFDGPFNFTLGFTTMKGEEPNFYSGRDWSSYENDWVYTDTSAACQAAIDSLYGVGGTLSGGESWLFKDLYTAQSAMDRAGSGNNVYACAGSPELMGYSDTGDVTFPANPNGESWAFYGNAEYKNTGIYFNTEYVLNSDWTLFGGIRYDEDEKDRTESAFADLSGMNAAGETCNDANFQDCFAIVGIGPHDSSVENYAGRGDLEWDDTTWNIGAEYRPNEDVMVYGRISTGYRPGGSLGYGQSQAPWQFDAEEMTNYEIGVKGMYLDGTLQLQATYFFQDFDTYWTYASRYKTEAELLIDPNSGPLTGEVNGISDTEIQGVELEGAWQITDALVLRGFYNYLGSDIGSYAALYPYAVPGETGTWIPIPWTDGEGNQQTSWIFGSGEPIEYGGNELVNQPKHKGSLTLAYDTPIPADWGNLELLTIVNYRSSKWVEPANFQAYEVDAYTRWDVRANWQSTDSAWSVTAYVQNILDEAALHLWSPRESTAAPWGTVVEPREFGLSVSWQKR